MTDLGHEPSQTTRHPDWVVQTVFDPDGGGYDFAYTIGLHERGLPELHVWARPPSGDDPGEDWMLSPSDRCVLLNQVAWRLVDGEVRVGSEWEASYDDGLARLRFRLDPPGDRDELEAFGIAPDALVLPLRWSLHRPHVSRPTPLPERARAQASRDFASIAAQVHKPFGLPRGWRMPAGEPRFESNLRFGPLTPVVTARAAQLAQMSSVELLDLIDLAAAVDMEGSVTYPAAVAKALARTAGRVVELRRLERECEKLVDALLQRPAFRKRWAVVEADWLARPADAETRRRLSRSLEGLLRAVVFATLSSEVVADALTTDQLVAARGPWLHAVSPVGELPGPEWSAPRDVVAQVCEWLTRLDGAGLWQFGHLHAAIGSGSDAESYAHLSLRLSGLAVTSSAGCPWAGCLDQLPAIRELAERQVSERGLSIRDVDLTIAPIPEIQAVATTLTAALVHAGRLYHEDIQQLTRRFEPVVPQLGSALRARR
jgi:hypothetical protein